MNKLKLLLLTSALCFGALSSAEMHLDKLEITGGMTFGGNTLKGQAYKSKQFRNGIIKISALRPIRDHLEFGPTIMHQRNGRAKGIYQVGSTSFSVHNHFILNPVMGTLRYSGNQLKGKFTPYFSLSLGLSLNHGKEIHKELEGENRSTTKFKGRTNIYPAYSIGLGGKYKITPEKNIILEYQFLDAGKVLTDSNAGSEKYKHRIKQNLIMLGLEFKL